MCGNYNKKPVGKCSLCGGVVSIPEIWHGVNRPRATCESCGAVMDDTANLPVVPMKPHTPWTNWPKDDHFPYISKTDDDWYNRPKVTLTSPAKQGMTEWRSQFAL